MIGRVSLAVPYRLDGGLAALGAVQKKSVTKEARPQSIIV